MAESQQPFETHPRPIPERPLVSGWTGDKQSASIPGLGRTLWTCLLWSHTLWPEVTVPHDLRWLLLPTRDVWKGRAEILLVSLTPTT